MKLAYNEDDNTYYVSIISRDSLVEYSLVLGAEADLPHLQLLDGVVSVPACSLAP